MGRIQWIDAVKGVAILLVMLAHLSEQAYPVLTWLVYGYVPIFFVMAGITYHPNSNWRATLRKRSARLWIPYFFYGISILVVASFLSKNVSFSHGLLGLCYGRYYLYPLGAEVQFDLLKGCFYLAPLWFLPCLWLSYLLMTLQDRMTHKWILPCIALLLSIASQYKPILLPLSLDTCFAGYLFMEVGRQLGKIKDRPLSGTVSVLIFGICVAIYYAVGLINCGTNMSVGNFGPIAPWSIFCFLLQGITESIGFAIFFRWVERTFLCRAFAYLGQEALRLMCIHLLVGSLIYKGLCLFPIPHLLCLILAISVVVGVNAILASLIDRVSRFGGKELISNL